jgi:sulfur carrier protein ThiS
LRFFRWSRAVNHQNFPDMLHRLRCRRRANCLDQLFSLRALVAKYPYLDELVALQIQVDFVRDLGRETGVSDRDDRLEVMRAGAECAALCGREAHGSVLSNYLNQNSLSVRHGRDGPAEQ